MAASLLFLLPGGPLHAQDSSTIEYPENGTGPVATYTAVDPEGAEIVSWSLDGDDAGDFNIEGGILTFVKSPDFEDPKGSASGSDNSNTYSVTVKATDETNKVGTRQVTVEVTNVDEPGTVTLSALQPQAGTMLTATDSDPDGTVADLKWQWAKSMTMDGTYENIDKAMSSTYTPKDADIDYYLQVTASYNDPEGEGKTAMGTSANAVQGVRSANNRPAFPDQNPDETGDQSEATTREVAENTPAGSAIGDPVVAEDEDGDILTYTLTGTDAGTFDIDWATGQIMTKGPLDEEAQSTHKVTVRATDPAGDPDVTNAVDTNSDEITVTITITDVNESPAIAGDERVTFNEVDDNIEEALQTYNEDNPEDDAPSTWSVAGADGSKFDISTDGALTFKAKPDYENPTDTNMDNVYEVTVRAADADRNTGTMDVKVTVINQNEEGTVTLSKTQPRIGVAVTASVTDPDGSISGLTWQWYDGAIADSNLETNAIEGANSDTYTPVAGDLDMTLMARASYADGEGEDKSASRASTKMVARDTRNKAPVFGDQDTETDGVQNTATTRKVEENTGALAGTDDDDAIADALTDNVDSPVMAEDPDPNADPLTYTLEGTDASKFRVRDNGQIEVGAGTELDYETKNTYMVTVMAEDSFGDSASIMVTITVTDLNEVPDITGEDTIEYPENRTNPVETYRASDPERAGTITWSLIGDDAALFDISSNGVLTFKKKPNYEMRADDDTNNMYEVTVQATDADRRMGTKPVTVEVTNVDEPGVVTLSARQPMAGVRLTATITDPDSVTTDNMTGSITTGVDWQWQKGSSNIPNADEGTYIPADTDRGSYLRATATYKDPESRRDTKRANVRSDYVVLRATSDNKAPEFADDQDPVEDGDQANAARKVAENTEAGENIGAPVRATDADSGQKLTYTLTGTDAGNFDIDWATGQLMTNEALDFETAPTLDDGKGFTVTVRATDPAGDPQVPTPDMDNSDTVMVTITVTDVNEPPTIAGGDASVTFDEDMGVIDTPLDTYTATDPEGVAVAATAWSTAGADGSKFEIGNGKLTFKDKPDYEMPTDTNKDNVYEVTVRAADGDGNRGEMAVKVTVENKDEAGTVTLSKTRPRVGIAVTASVTDPDGTISGLTWKWSIREATDQVAAPDGDIEDANSDTYIPKAGDVGGTLTATASYFDGASDHDTTTKTTANADSANAVAADTRNKAPMFEDQDTETDGVQNTATTRKVEENAEAVDDAAPDVAMDNVGRPVTANDPDPNEDDLTYTLSGADADSFTVKDNGQIEVGARTKLDYETKQTYMVTVMAEDSFGASATIMVTITVTDMDEAPEIMRAPDENVAPEFADSEDGARSVAENTAAGEDIGNPVAAADANSDALTYALSGTDAASFDIDPDTGQLMTLAALDYETKASYSVTVAASDSGGLSDSIDVTVTVTNVDEAPVITGDAALDYAENGTGPVATYSATDPESATITWSLGGDDAADFDISAGGVLTFKSSPDHETPADADTDNAYEVTVVASDGTNTDTHDVTITVTNVDEAPPVITGDAALDYAENGTGPVATYSATDPESATITWSLGGDDAAHFDISAGGVLTFKSSPDHETPADADTDNAYEVTVVASDGTNTDTHDVTITVTNVDEAPPVITGDAALDYAENGTGPVATYSVTDPDSATITLSLGGDDAADFDISAGGVLTFKSSPDHETPADADTDNAYEVTVTASDSSGLSESIDVTITVTNVDEAPPVITGDAALDYAENGTGPVATYSATDPDSATITLSLGGDDAADFDISAGGVLTFKSSPDHETPADADTDNAYEVTVVASDGTNTDTHDVTITVTNVDEAPVITGDAALDYAENGTGPVATYSATDPESATITWSLGGDDAADFDISAGGVLTFKSSPDHETPADADTDNAYEVTVTASDSSGLSESIDVTITVTDVDEEEPADPVGRYDKNNNGRIDKDELVDGVFDYNVEQTLSKDELVELIFSYEIG